MLTSLFQPRLPIFPPLSQRRALRNSDSACTTIFDEVDGKPIEAPRDLVYYCSFIGCIRSATPGLCDLTSPIAKKILDLESRKVYLLKGPSPEELRAHTWDAHGKAVEDVTVCPKPVIAEERKFRVPLEAFPGASGWLMRIQNGDDK